MQQYLWHNYLDPGGLCPLQGQAKLIEYCDLQQPLSNKTFPQLQVYKIHHLKSVQKAFPPKSIMFHQGYLVIRNVLVTVR